MKTTAAILAGVYGIRRRTKKRDTHTQPAATITTSKRGEQLYLFDPSEWRKKNATPTRAAGKRALRS